MTEQKSVEELFAFQEAEPSLSDRLFGLLFPKKAKTWGQTVEALKLVDRERRDALARQLRSASEVNALAAQLENTEQKFRQTQSDLQSSVRQNLDLLSENRRVKDSLRDVELECAQLREEGVKKEVEVTRAYSYIPLDNEDLVKRYKAVTSELETLKEQFSRIRNDLPLLYSENPVKYKLKSELRIPVTGAP